MGSGKTNLPFHNGLYRPDFITDRFRLVYTTDQSGVFFIPGKRNNHQFSLPYLLLQHSRNGISVKTSDRQRHDDICKFHETLFVFSKITIL